MGYPQPSYGFARILEVMLEDAVPGRKFEVFNVGVTAINSHVVRVIARECAALQPDLFIVYVGNNEVVGPYGPGTLFDSFGSSLRLIRASMWTRTTGLGQLFQKLAESEDVPIECDGMAMFVDHQIHPRDPRFQGVFGHLRVNLTDICNYAGAAGASVVLCTVASNLKDCPPFASLHRNNWGAG